MEGKKNLKVFEISVAIHKYGVVPVLAETEEAAMQWAQDNPIDFEYIIEDSDNYFQHWEPVEGGEVYEDERNRFENFECANYEELKDELDEEEDCNE